MGGIPMTQSSLDSFKDIEKRAKDASEDVGTINHTIKTESIKINRPGADNDGKESGLGEPFKGAVGPNIPLQTNLGSKSISRTMWTNEQWRKEYWRTTNESPKDLVARAESRNDNKTLILLDLIKNGDPYNRRKKENRDKGKYFLDPFDWHLLVELVNTMREGKR
jgi:hypothetical protein